MDPAEIVMRNVQRDRRKVIIKLLREGIGQAGEPALAHPFNVNWLGAKRAKNERGRQLRRPDGAVSTRRA
jgi:hypothetical protein